jgi:hypothetical protein
MTVFQKIQAGLLSGLPFHGQKARNEILIPGGGWAAFVFGAGEHLSYLSLYV